MYTLIVSTYASKFFSFSTSEKKETNSTYMNMNNLVQEGPPEVTESNIPLKAESAREGCLVQSGISPRMETPPLPEKHFAMFDYLLDEKLLPNYPIRISHTPIHVCCLLS